MSFGKSTKKLNDLLQLPDLAMTQRYAQCVHAKMGTISFTDIIEMLQTHQWTQKQLAQIHSDFLNTEMNLYGVRNPKIQDIPTDILQDYTQINYCLRLLLTDRRNKFDQLRHSSIQAQFISEELQKIWAVSQQEVSARIVFLQQFDEIKHYPQHIPSKAFALIWANIYANDWEKHKNAQALIPFPLLNFTAQHFAQDNKWPHEELLTTATRVTKFLQKFNWTIEDIENIVSELQSRIFVINYCLLDILESTANKPTLDFLSDKLKHTYRLLGYDSLIQETNALPKAQRGNLTSLLKVTSPLTTEENKYYTWLIKWWHRESTVRMHIKNITSIFDAKNGLVKLEKSLSNVPTKRSDIPKQLLQNIQLAWQNVLPSKRHFQIPPKGYFELLLPNHIAEKIGLSSIQFIQEGINPPGVGFLLHFAHVPNITPFTVGLWLNSNSSWTGFHSLLSQPYLINLYRYIAITYLHALVRPLDKIQTQTSNRFVSNTSTQKQSSPNERRLADKRYVQTRPDNQLVPLNLLKEEVKRQPHFRRGHLREVENPSPEAVHRGQLAGFDMPEKTTYVRPSNIGPSQSGFDFSKILLPSDGMRLVKKTQIEAPLAIIKELESYI